MNTKSKTIYGFISIVFVASLFLFQNCAKNPNLSSYSQQASTSPTPTPTPSSNPTPTPSTQYPISVALAVFVQSYTSTLTLTSAPTNPIDIGYYYSVASPVPSDLTNSNFTETIESSSGYFAAQMTFPNIINANVPVVNGQMSEGLATGIQLPSNLPPGTYTLAIEFTDSSGNPISMHPETGVSQDQFHSGYYDVGTLIMK